MTGTTTGAVPSGAVPTETVTTGVASTGTGTVHLVPHSHWDREWYEPFQRSRLRLVGLLDHVLEWVEADLGFRFALDVQMAAVDDDLEARGKNSDRIAAAAAALGDRHRRLAVR
jgi:hypothetical protein